MMFATTTVAVYRGTTTTALGDDADDDSTPVAGLERVSIAITEQTRTPYDQASSELRVIRIGTARVTPGIDIRQDDRLHDLAGDRWWLVTSGMRTRRDAIGGRTVVFDLRGT